MTESPRTTITRKRSLGISIATFTDIWKNIIES